MEWLPFGTVKVELLGKFFEGGAVLIYFLLLQARNGMQCSKHKHRSDYLFRSWPTSAQLSKTKIG